MCRGRATSVPCRISFRGYQKVDDEAIRGKFEADWGVTLPTTKGLDNREMIEAIHKGKLKALYIKGEDTITSDANANDVGEALRMLDFLIVQDIYFLRDVQVCRLNLAGVAFA